MSEETTTVKTHTVELDEELAYQQLVAFHQGVVDYNKAEAEEDTEAMLAAANGVIEGTLPLINDLVSKELSDTLYARLEQEHPELVPEEPTLEDILRQLMGGIDVQIVTADDDPDA